LTSGLDLRANSAALALIAIHHRHAGACPGKAFGHAAADAGGSPRNDRDLPMKRERAHAGNPILQPFFAVT
jgi:hypothetical protein